MFYIYICFVFHFLKISWDKKFKRMKIKYFVLSGLLSLYSTLNAQSSCQDELNAANLELSNKRLQEYAWEQERKKFLDSLKTYRLVNQGLTDSLRQVQTSLKTATDSIRTLQQELKDRIVVKTIHRKTGRIFPEGIYLSNEHLRYPDSDTTLLFYRLDSTLIRVPFDLVKEKNKLMLTAAEKYKIQRCCQLLQRYIPICRLRLWVYYPAAGSHLNVIPKRSAEVAAQEMITFLTTEYEDLFNEIKIEVRYGERATAKPQIEFQLTNKMF
jgi:hypothetical protein